MLLITGTGGKGIDVADESANDILWMSGLRCNGDEDSILECPETQLGVFRSECAGKGFAAVACLSEGKRIYIDIVKV